MGKKKKTETRWYKVKMMSKNFSQKEVVDLVREQHGVKRILSVLRLWAEPEESWIVRTVHQPLDEGACFTKNKHTPTTTFVKHNFCTTTVTLLNKSFLVPTTARGGVPRWIDQTQETGVIPYQIEEPLRTILLEEVPQFFSVADVRWFFKDHKLCVHDPVVLVDRKAGHDNYVVKFRDSEGAAQAYRSKVGDRGAFFGSKRVFLRRFY